MNINKYIKERQQENDFRATHDVSSAVSVKAKGKKAYLGARLKQKKSYWQRLKEITLFDLKNARDVLTGKKSLLQAIKDRNKVAHQDLMDNNKIYRDAVSTMQGIKDAMKADVDKKIASNAVLTRLKDNVKAGIADTAQSNELHHKYEVSEPGIQPKSSFWNRIKNVLAGKKSVYAEVRDNVKDVRRADTVIYGTYSGIRKTLHELRVAKPKQFSEKGQQGAENENLAAKRAHILALRNGTTPEKLSSNGERLSFDQTQKPQVQTRSDVYTALEVVARISALENASGLANSGISYNGMDKSAGLAIIQQASPEEIRQAASQIKADAMQKPLGNVDFNSQTIRQVDKLQQQYAPDQATPNKYATLDNGQFSVAMGTAYENLVWMEHHGASKEAKVEVLGEIKQIVAEAQKRWPNAQPEALRGDYFKDNDVAMMEQQLMPYMREAAKNNRVLAADVYNYAAWRQNQNAEISKGGVGPAVSEIPFQNAARYGTNNVEKSDLPANCFKNAYEKGNSVMSATQMAQARAKIAELHIR